MQSQVWYISLIPAPERQRQEDQEEVKIIASLAWLHSKLEISLGYVRLAEYGGWSLGGGKG